MLQIIAEFSFRSSLNERNMLKEKMVRWKSKSREERKLKLKTI